MYVFIVYLTKNSNPLKKEMGLYIWITMKFITTFFQKYEDLYIFYWYLHLSAPPLFFSFFPLKLSLSLPCVWLCRHFGWCQRFYGRWFSVVMWRSTGSWSNLWCWWQRPFQTSWAEVWLINWSFTCVKR